MNLPQSLSPEKCSVGFISLGCAKNLVDSQVMAGALLSSGAYLARSPEEANVVVVNTCAFIETAREESIEEILSACELKKHGLCKAVIVAGCLPQRYKKDLKESLPEVDAFIGLDELEKIGEIAQSLLAGSAPVFEVSQEAQSLFEPKDPALVFTGGAFAYLKIAEGCNHRCAFCAIPAIRGAYRSRSISSLVHEAEVLLDAGIKELNLISQDTTAYGQDLTIGSNLPGLLQALGEIDGDFWIRILYSTPTAVDDRLLKTMADIPQVCRYLDIPIQHSHPDILRAMRRTGTDRDLAQRITHIRTIIPDITLRTTCLVGFPGEEEEHFQHLLDFTREMKFDHLGVFVFSPEENTAAFEMPDRPEKKVAVQRREQLMLAQKEIVDGKNTALNNIQTKILLERPCQNDDNVFIGRSERQAPEVDSETLVENVPPGTGPGTFVNIRYTEPSGYDMRGRCAGGAI